MVSVDGLYPAIEMAGISPDLILTYWVPNGENIRRENFLPVFLSSILSGLF
jgi:hypothetical protein